MRRENLTGLQAFELLAKASKETHITVVDVFCVVGVGDGAVAVAVAKPGATAESAHRLSNPESTDRLWSRW